MPIDPATRRVLDRCVGPEPPARRALTPSPSRDCALHAAWVDGEIPGFPEDDAPRAAATRWLMRLDEVERAARDRRRFA